MSEYSWIFESKVGEYIKGIFDGNSQKNKWSYLADMSGQIGNLLNVPYSFNENSDPNDRVFKKTILADSFILNIAPGEPEFTLAEVTSAKNKGTKVSPSEYMNEMKEKFAGEAKGEASQAIADVLLQSAGSAEDLRYYKFKYTWGTYYQYVQVLTHYLYSRMKFKRESFTYHANDTLAEYDKGSNLFKGNHGSLAFFADYRATSVSESASNTFGPSMLEEFVKTGSQKLKEARFLFGLEGVDPNTNKTQGALDSFMQGAGELFGSLTSGLGMSQIGGSINTIVSGSQAMFPSIWSDSEFSRSYDIGLRLHSPYGTPSEIFKRVYFPLMCLFALTLPRQRGAIDFLAPFLVRVDCPGWFRINCGVITSITIKKAGDDNLWTIDGLPMQIDVNISIQDMYPMLMVCNTVEKLSYNNGLLDFLDNMAGLQLDEIDLVQQVGYALRNKLNVFGNTAESLKHKVLDWRNTGGRALFSLSQRWLR